MEKTERANTLENVVYNQVKIMKWQVTQCGRNVEKGGNLLHNLNDMYLRRKIHRLLSIHERYGKWREEKVFQKMRNLILDLLKRKYKLRF